MKKLLALGLAAAMFAGCQTPTTMIDTSNDRAPAVAGIDYRDVQAAATALLDSLRASGRLERDDGKVWLMTVGKVENDTMQRIDVDNVTNYLLEEIVNYGLAEVTSAMAYSESNRDEMIDAVRSVRGDAEFNQSTVAGMGELESPDLGLKGKITQREIRMDNGDKQIEYYFSMMITNLRTGRRFWQKQHLIGKRTDAKTPTW